VITNTLDASGRRTSSSISLATGVGGHTLETIGYNALNLPTSFQTSGTGRPTITVERVYDSLGYLLSETQKMTGWTNRTITYGLDDKGQRLSVTRPAGDTYTHTLDARGRRTETEDASNNTLAAWTYFGPGLRLDTLDHANGTSVEASYNGFRELEGLYHKDSANTTFAGFEYGFDKVGNKLYEEMTHKSGQGDVYRYDKAYRLVEAVIGSSDASAESAIPDSTTWTESITYDMGAHGNRQSVVKTPYQQTGVTTSYTTNAMNEYTVVGGTNRSHDDNGNLIDDGTNTYLYDCHNHLIKVTRNSDGYVLGEYFYDGLGRRMRKDTEDGTVSERHLYDGIHVVEERDSGGNVLRKFGFGQGVDQPLWMEAPDQADVDGDLDTSELVRLYYHMDASGSVTQLTDASQGVVESYKYGPFGSLEVFDSGSTSLSDLSAVGNPYGFRGTRYDSASGIYIRAGLAYAPHTGRYHQGGDLAMSQWKPWGRAKIETKVAPSRVRWIRPWEKGKWNLIQGGGYWKLWEQTWEWKSKPEHIGYYLSEIEHDLSRKLKLMVFGNAAEVAEKTAELKGRAIYHVWEVYRGEATVT